MASPFECIYTFAATALPSKKPSAMMPAPFEMISLVDIHKEMPGLWRQAVLAAGEAVEAVEFPEGLQAGLKADFDAFLLGFLDVATGRIPEAIEELLGPGVRLRVWR